jgi:class 3 adenylate cyclase
MSEPDDKHQPDWQPPLNVCELLDDDIGGLAVHIAARIMGQAGAGEILVSRTVRDSVVGSGTGFEDRGSVECVACPAPGNCWRSTATARGRDRPRQSWHQCRPPVVGPRCAGRTAPWR